MKLRCYCCGEELDGTIALVTMSETGTDRVFVMKPEHVARVEDVEVIFVAKVDL